jgi:EAL domain-containing protein (putative c-di-GMP-specific phosphodiesterase class I)/ActR/RegA family two-component response regulator
MLNEYDVAVGAAPPLDVVVVVDDEPSILHALSRSLAGSFEVETFEDAEHAMARVKAGGVSVVLSDIGMPGMSGLDLLGAARELDPDLPFVLITGAPSVESATKAIERGVFRYLPKPLDGEEIALVVGQASQFRRLALLKREALELRGAQSTPRPLGGSLSFRQALAELWVVFQPIVSVAGKSVYGYEALMRSAHPDFRSPSQLLSAAERSQALNDLGRAVRARAAAGSAQATDSALLFVNLHPQDLADPELAAPDSPLVAIADRVVLEITERASLGGIDQLQGRIAELRKLGFRIAVDDLGAGYAGLTSFALLEPEIVKLDMSLTRGVDRSSVKQKLVGSIGALCREMGITIVVEGVETPEERDTLVGLGCDLLQGHLFGYPERVPSAPTW